MVYQDKGIKRNTIDKYYTKPAIVHSCINYIKVNIDIQNSDTIIEPSAGDGAFIQNIKTLSKNCIFYDLEPEHSEIIQQDFLHYNHPINDSEVHVIGNPPFGRQSSTAIKFIKKACTFSNSISFILPRSFKKESMKKHFHLNFHLIFEWDIPDNSFTVEGKIHDVPCVFQIWVRKKEPRPQNVKLTPINYIFVKKDACPDIAFRRVGVYAGKIDTNIENKSSQSHYFIKFTNFNSELYDRLSNIRFDCSSNTVGPRSISKQELISLYNLNVNPPNHEHNNIL
tara:strand:- start:4244 stop:5089 length:846 start_codon:yes stop_codon:yes gene_type:complete